jgi:hypothetical protein
MMDDNYIIEIIKKIEHFSLEKEKRDLVRKNLSLYIEESEKRKRERETKKNFAFFVGNIYLAPALVLFVVFFGGLSFYSENALPGDTSYFVKTKINEPVRGSLYLTPARKAQWSGTLVDRRTEEVEKLAVYNKLTPDREEFLTKKVEEERKKIETTTGDDTQNEKEKVNARIALYESTIYEFSHAQEADSPPMVMSAKALSSPGEESGASFESFSVAQDSSLSPEEKGTPSIQKLAKNRGIEARARIESLKSFTKEEPILKAIYFLEKEMEDGTILLENTFYPEAYLIFKKVLRKLIDIEAVVF